MYNFQRDRNADSNTLIDLSPKTQHQPWWRTYQYSLSLILFVVILMAGRLWFIHGNPPPKNLNELEMQKVDVVEWRVNGSRLFLRLPTGEVRQVEFPSLDFKQPGLYLAISLEEQKSLVGRRCTIWSRPMRRVFGERFQVFAVQCDGVKGLPFQIAKKDYEITFEVSSSGRSAFVVFTPLLLAFFLIEYIQKKQMKKKEITHEHS